jgi:hypothetical protein
MTLESGTGQVRGGPKEVPMLPLLLFASGALLFAATKLIGALTGGGKSGVKSHQHEALNHQHDHVHVTHSRTDPDKGVGGWEHLTAEHSHPHNHPALEHSHRPHRDFEAEHRREAHVHDHEHPMRS